MFESITAPSGMTEPGNVRQRLTQLPI
ncbi:hypothetical protein EMIT0111MI5_20431 [Burkholderia sp. IT-111MI5]